MLNQYSFLSWARKGIANSISATAGPSVSRAEIKLNVVLNGENVAQNIQLYGPQDVVGVNPNMVIRTEPRNWITDFEPNYMSFIEFYEEDFPWRYSPKRPDGTHLQPWMALVVLKDDEFEADDKTIPLPSFKIKKDAALLFPPHDQMWAWAHVHVNSSITQASDLDNLLKQNADMAYSRLMCPRKLKPNTGYHAFVVPTYESGRLGGISLTKESEDPSVFGKSSWDGKQAGTAFPYYHRWYFRTGEAGDFEFLLTQLVPRTADQSIGKRDMDMSKPNFGSKWTETDTTLAIEGALKSPLMPSDVWPTTAALTDFQTDLQRLINLPEKLMAQGDPTPVVSVPFYVHKHILEKTINITNTANQDFWLTELNRDPRNRASSGLGTKVIQKNQERFMDEAWKQVKNIKELNQMIIFVQLAIKSADRVFTKHLVGMKPERAISMTQYVHTKIKNSPITIRKALTDSLLPTAAVSATFRRLTRANGALARRISSVIPFSPDSIIKGLNDGTLTTAPPQPAPVEANSYDDAVKTSTQSNFPEWLRNLILNTNTFLLLLIFLLLFILGLIFWLPWLMVASLILGIIAYFVIENLKKRFKTEELLKNSDFTPEQIDNIPPRPNFTIVESDTAPPLSISSGNVLNDVLGLAKDSVEATNFRVALRNFFPVINERPEPEPIRVALDLKVIQSKVYKAVEPHRAIANRFLGSVKFDFAVPIRPDFFADVIVPVMDYPDFKEAMYRPLRDLGKEFMCPNINKLPPDTISLLETNPKFIESYMVGLNHEMGRELLWREYPTDQRGSYFRQFWDVNGYVIPDPNLTEEQKAEKLRDIPRIHEWGKRSKLGAHPNPMPTPPPPAPVEKLVLTIRSSLFKRYPNTVVFAQKAKWNATLKKLEMDEQLEIDFNKPYDDNIIKTPIFGADMLPDIKFFGFNLTAEVARGNVQNPAADPGWFFVIMERPGEPRFGMDEPKKNFFDAPAPKIDRWNDLTWGYLVNSQNDLDQLNTINLNTVKKPVLNPSVLPSTTDSDDIEQSNEDRPHLWGKDSADLAYIMYQAPVKVAVHASEMLEGL
jgi:hypothetical protein